MASWLSAGSVDDGTVVRRASAAHANLKFDAPDLFAPTKLESIFNNDEPRKYGGWEEQGDLGDTGEIFKQPRTLDLQEDLSVVSDLVSDSGRISVGSRTWPPQPDRSLLSNPVRNYRRTSKGSRKPTPQAGRSLFSEPGSEQGQTPKGSRKSSPQAERSLLSNPAASRDTSSVKEAEQMSFIPSPVKTRPTNPIINILDESSLPSDLSQGTSIAVKPKNRQSLGTGDYLSEASRVMTYLRQTAAPATADVSQDWETEEEESSFTDSDWRQYVDSSIVEKSPVRKYLGAEEVSLQEVQDARDLIRDPAKIETTVIRSPSPVREASDAGESQYQEVHDAMELMSDPAKIETTVIRSPSKHVDWVEHAAASKYSILSLTPLPDFTAYEDDPQHPERSFIDERAHERALRQAHGSLALSRDALIQAITDAKPDQLYWEEITELDLKATGLGSLHGLNELCPNLVVLDASENSLTHLNGIPASVRTLNVSRNLLSDMVCWSGLKNLHCLDICGNKNITNLDGLGELVHLRTLRAAACSINNIDGIKILDGLLDLQLQLNKLKTVDFGRTNFDQLESLDMSTNKLESVTNLSKLVSLEDLHLSQNLLTEIVPVGRRGPRCLQTLEADQNQIEFFNLKQYPKLRYAMLDDNKLTRVHGLGKTPYFEELSIRNQAASSDLVNRILSTPNDCNTLMLSGNPLPDGKLELPELPQHSLRALEMTDCGIKELGKGFGRQFPNLRLLNLNYNHIQEIGDLQGMHKIKRLELIRNRITRMRRTCLLLARLPTLAVLDIRDNPLTMAFHPVKGEDEEADAKWLRSCDENTKMRRRLTELLLAEHCKQLRQVNGLGFDRAKVLKKEEVWKRCEERGALRGQ